MTRTGHGWSQSGAVDPIPVATIKGEETSEYDPAGYTTIGDKSYIVFRYDGLSAAEMETVVSVCVSYSGVSGTAINASVKSFAEEYKAANGQHTALVDAMLKYGASVKALTDAKK